MALLIVRHKACGQVVSWERQITRRQPDGFVETRRGVCWCHACDVEVSKDEIEPTGSVCLTQG